MDGTLLDSMMVWVKIDTTFVMQFGIIPDAEYRDKVTSLNYAQAIEYMRDRYGIPMTFEEIARGLYKCAYIEYSQNIPLKEGAAEYLAKLYNDGVTIVLATSGDRRLATAAMERTGILQYFHHQYYCNEHDCSKTCTTIFEKILADTGFAPEDCTVFEDMPFSARSARSVGMRTVGVFDEFSSYQADALIESTDIQIHDFTELI